jgi:DNA-binding transcriptional regulator LsrR (DeoR family)
MIIEAWQCGMNPKEVTMEDIELLCEVARLYYENNLTQNEISTQVHTSRSTVSRLLQEAREKGIVEIIIHYPWDRSLEFEQEFSTRFGLSDVRILDSNRLKQEDIAKGVHQLAARYIQGLLKPNMLLGISWGRTIYHTIQKLRPEQKLPVKIIQLFGAANVTNHLTDGPDLVRQMAKIFGGECHFIHAPLFIENAKAKEALLQDRHIKQTLTLASQADVALTGIGSLEDTLIDSHTSSSYLSPGAVRELQSLGAVGHICAQYYDIHGNIIDTAIHRGIIGISIHTLHKIKQVVGIAHGDSKVKPILGALRGKYINTLITDTTTANKVLSMATTEP